MPRLQMTKQAPPWRVAVLFSALSAITITSELARTWHGLGNDADLIRLLYLVAIYLTAEWWGLGWALTLTLCVGFGPGVRMGAPLPVVSMAVWGVGAGISLLVHQHHRHLASQRAALDQARREAMCDELTGLMNWRQFRQSVATWFQQYPGQPISLLMVDIDHFKQYNDAHGHMAGDRLLALVARLISQSLPQGAMAFRYGGEEFAVLLPSFRSCEAVAAAERIRQRVAGTSLSGTEALPGGRLTISVGVASFPLHAQYPEQLIQRADEAMYEAKRAGRNRVAAVRGACVGA